MPDRRRDIDQIFGGPGRVKRNAAPALLVCFRPHILSKTVISIMASAALFFEAKVRRKNHRLFQRLSEQVDQDPLNLVPIGKHPIA